MSEVAKVFIVSPDHMEFIPWAQSVTVSCKGCNIPDPVSEDKWKDWAASLVPLRGLGVVPSTDHFDKWQDWAYNFIRSVKQN